MPEPRVYPQLKWLYTDGQIYERYPNGWPALLYANLYQGDALFIPPGTVHETQNIQDDCAASLTFQLAPPRAAGFYRTFWQRARNTADFKESWNWLSRDFFDLLFAAGPHDTRIKLLWSEQVRRRLDSSDEHLL